MSKSQPLPSESSLPSWWRWTLLIPPLVMLGCAAGWWSWSGAAPPVQGLPRADYKITAKYPHDPQAFCQGLEYHGGQLYEGTGKYGQSQLRRVELKTGNVLQKAPLDPRVFGEGITILGDKIYQLTWKSQIGFVYDLKTLRPLARFRYAGQGWGLANDGQQIIMSDGSSILRFLDPGRMRVVRRLKVRIGRTPVDRLNELEYVNGEIWANVWYEDQIIRIHPKTGQVVGLIDLTDLYPAADRPHKDAVLNGIAYDAENDRVFVTGKDWPNLFELKIE